MLNYGVRLAAADVLKCAAVFMFDRHLLIEEFYARFDDNNTLRLGGAALAKLIKGVMPAVSPAEIKKLAAEFIAVFDVDCDGFISPSEFKRAMEIGEPELPQLEEHWDIIDIRGKDQGRGCISHSLDRLQSEHAVLRKV